MMRDMAVSVVGIENIASFFPCAFFPMRVTPRSA
jgi:hypothetical protein